MPVDNRVDSVLREAIQGIERTGAQEQVKTSAVSALREWLSQERFSEYVPAVASLVRRGKFALLLDSFYTMLPFGTGGRRGPVGPGPNRINPYTVTTSVQGHCRFLRSRFPEGMLRVVVAADVRRFLDLRGNYDRDSLGALYGLTSRDLSVMAACVYAANGVHVTMVDPGQDSFLSTPELSFHIFDQGANGGLNVSASHNHPDDNGAKFYNAAGGQEVPPHDEQLVEVAAGVRDAKTMPFEEACRAGLVEFLTPAQRARYRAANLALLNDKAPRGRARIAFSSLHGTGLTTAWPLLKEAGFSAVLADSQAAFDGAFPTVPYLAPNPEVPSAMEEVIRVARESGCDLAMATDPDADRLGAAVPDPAGKWRCLTGNQIGLLMAWHMLETRKEQGRLSGASYLVKTEVTTHLLEQMARAYGVRCIGHLLVGFKYIGDVLDSIRRTGRWGTFEATEADFIMAMEESHGVLACPDIRDKDAANGALLLAELAERCKVDGLTVFERLLSIYRQFGYAGTALKSVTMEGVEGLADIRRVQESLRRDPPMHIGGRKVLAFHDRQDPGGVFGAIRSETDRASRDVLVFELEGGGRVILRPSGTEPKSKSYAEQATPPLGQGASADEVQAVAGKLDRELAELLSAWEQEMMRRIGIDYPVYATHLGGSVPLHRKLQLVRTVAPRLEVLVSTGEVTESTVSEARTLLSGVAPLPMLRAGLVVLGRSWAEPKATRMAELLGKLS
jgi:phosphoglucomutase/phosphomannomutase